MFELDTNHIEAVDLQLFGAGAYPLGDYYYDSSLYNAHGTLVGATWTHDSRRGAVLNCGGSADSFYADVNKDDFLSGTRARTVTCWIKSSLLSSVRRAVSSQPSGGSPSGLFTLRTSGDKAQCIVSDSSGLIDSVTGTTVLSTDIWYHLTLRIIENSASEVALDLFLDGETDGTQNVISSSNSYAHTADLNLGKLNAGGETFAGLVGDVRIYNWALPDDLIKQIADPSNPGPWRSRQRRFISLGAAETITSGWYNNLQETLT